VEEEEIWKRRGEREVVGTSVDDACEVRFPPFLRILQDDGSCNQGLDKSNILSGGCP